MKSPIATKEKLHAAIRAAIGSNGGKRVSYVDFIAASGMKHRDVFGNYSKWDDAVRAAGFKFQPYHSKAGRSLLLTEWGGVVRKLRRLPTQTEYNIHGPRHGITLGREFGSWHNLPAAFRRFAGKRKEWADVLKLLNSLPKNTTPQSKASRPRFARKPRPPKAPSRRMRDRPAFGPLLDIPALRHAPVNEQGVVYLFGILAERLGFTVEHLQTTFPDCFAKRRTSRDGWQNVDIEFEYESRNFQRHRHNPAACDLIVCWHHNWPDCPKNLEVIALSDEVARYRAAVASAVPT